MTTRDVRGFLGREVYFRLRNGARRHANIAAVSGENVVWTSTRERNLPASRRYRHVIPASEITWMARCLSQHEQEHPDHDEIPGEPPPRVMSALRATRIRTLPRWRRWLRRITLP